MRTALCDALLARSADPGMVFLTGDLGFMALEPLQEAMGERFINCGIAEQNMIAVSAALAKQSLDVWVYSIGPFCYARPFEHIRNNIAFHALPVKLIGNGGGYGYGVMGPSHHAIEDYGVLLTLPNMRVFAPVFDEDIADVVAAAQAIKKPAYLRLGRGEHPAGYSVPPYAPWRKLTTGHGMTVIAVGALAGSYLETFEALPSARRPNLWAMAQMPLESNPPPDALLQEIAEGPGLCIAEEHVSYGGFAAAFAYFLAVRRISVKAFHSFHARAHEFGQHGSQAYLRKCSSLDALGILTTINA